MRISELIDLLRAMQHHAGDAHVMFDDGARILPVVSAQVATPTPDPGRLPQAREVWLGAT